MRRTEAGRTLLFLAVAIVGLAAAAPRRLPELEAAGDPARPVADLTAFGLRVIATALAGYVALVLLALLLTAARLLPSVLRRGVHRWTTRGLAGGLRQLIGASAVVLGVLPLQPIAAHAEPPPPVLAPADLPPAPPAGPAPRLEPLPPATVVPTPTVPPVLEPPDPPSPASPSAPSAPTPTAERSVTVAAGDSFWSIAQQSVRNHLGRTPTDVEVLEPWLALIDLNRGRLLDPADPDLLHPGQLLRLPDL